MENIEAIFNSIIYVNQTCTYKIRICVEKKQLNRAVPEKHAMEWRHGKKKLESKIFDSFLVWCRALSLAKRIFIVFIQFS